MAHASRWAGICVVCLLTLLFPQTADAGRRDWKITQPEWTESDERGYQEFVQALGESDCRTINQCLASSANVYRHTDPKYVRYFVDCADLPYFLRAYYAWKNGLPFSFGKYIFPARGRSRDFRYSLHGNKIIERHDVVQQPGEPPVDAVSLMSLMRDAVSSGTYRIHPDYDVPVNFSDHYPVKIDRENIKPGTIIYDVKGHLAIVYRVEDDGRIRIIQAHTDNTITRTQFSTNMPRSRPAHGGGLKNWRPLKLVGATRQADGSYVGGRIVAKGNHELPGYSKEQYYGTEENPGKDWQQAEFVHKGESLDFYRYVRTKLSLGEFKYRPVVELRNTMQSLCEDTHSRVLAVEQAILNGVDRKPHPPSLPDNIYGTFGEWESFSTPSRDARLKVSFKELRDQVEMFLDMHRQGDNGLEYNGVNLARDLLDAYEEEAEACQITYENSVGRTVTLTLADVHDRLFKLSFDPYHCIEQRWGATAPEDLASCRDGAIKRRWYQAEQALRNQMDRTYNVFMGYTLAELETPGGLGKGVPEPPDLDVVSYLKSQEPAAEASAVHSMPIFEFANLH